jgi:hypothetical protein
MYSWLNDRGEIVKTKTIAEFARKYNFPPSMARSLASGCRSRLRGWCSTSKRAKRHRNRFMTKLVHLPTGATRVLGSSITQFARENALCENEVWKLVNGLKTRYRGWTLQKTIDAATFGLADINI